MKLHVLGFAFSELTREWEHCAFSARTRVFASMMSKAGYEVITYGGEESEALASENVCCITAAERRAFWPDYDPKRDVFNDFDPSAGWNVFNSNAAASIRHRAELGDVLCITMGLTHRPVADYLQAQGLFVCETGIGYSGVWAPHRVFESHAWRHFLAAREPTDDVRFYDEVIPRAYEVEDFPAGKGDGGYFLFVGRLTERKGPHIAALACERIGAKLLVAGQGEMDLPGDVEFLGTVGPERRAELMGGAIAVFCPSLYLEPFCGVSVEAQLCGTPVIASNWGALVENVSPETGFRCNTLAEFADAAREATSLGWLRETIRERAQDRWSTEAVAPRFDEYFGRLESLMGPGWYA